MRRKGRLQSGSDPDVVVFDPAAIPDRASYANSTRPSAGIVHASVNGTFVVRDGDILTDALPGRPSGRARVEGASAARRPARKLTRTQGSIYHDLFPCDRIYVLII
jgi:N-acyl-D-aspartate/D-glutamate deacylase